MPGLEMSGRLFRTLRRHFGRARLSRLAARTEPPALLGLGEPTHGIEAFPLLRNELLGHLVGRGYRSIALETCRVRGPAVNDFVQHGMGDLDTVMKLGMNHPMGPLQLADFIGLDTCLAILNVLHDGFKDPKYRPCPLLVQKVQAGHLGKKAGRGFYKY